MQDNFTDTLFADHYRIVEKIGSSEVSEVFRAIDENLGRTVALKIIKPEYTRDPMFHDTFRHTALSAARLSNPHIVTFLDYGIYDSTHYVVMEFVQGASIAQALARRGVIAQRKVAQIATQVCDALGYAHGQGVIHGAINSQNIIVQPDGEVKVMDFGVPRVNSIDLSRESSAVTFQKVRYLSPEQIRGQVATARSDIYSLGLVLYEAICGQLPFVGDDPATIALQQLRDEPTPPSVLLGTMDPRLESIIMRCLEKDPARRFSSIDEISPLMRNITAGAPIARAATRTMPQPSYDRTEPMPTESEDTDGRDGGFERDRSHEDSHPRETKRRKWPIVLIIVLVLAAAGLGTWYYLTAHPTVPDLGTLTEADATQKIADAGFVLDGVSRSSSETVASGHVMSQSPQANSRAAKGSGIRITVSTGSPNDQVGVPDLTGMTPEQAQTTLSALGFTAKMVDSQNSATVAAGKVCAQSPTAGSQAAKGSAISLSLSLGAANVTVPDVVGMSQNDGSMALSGLGLTVKVVEEYSSAVTSGNIISTNPAANTSVAAGSTVSVSVSKGPASSAVTVPNLRGQSADEARASLTAVGLKMEVTYSYLDGGNGKVESQVPAAGAQVDANSTVTVVISGMPS